MNREINYGNYFIHKLQEKYCGTNLTKEMKNPYNESDKTNERN